MAAGSGSGVQVEAEQQAGAKRYKKKKPQPILALFVSEVILSQNKSPESCCFLVDVQKFLKQPYNWDMTPRKMCCATLSPCQLTTSPSLCQLMLVLR